ncbi:SPOR domain-containing protein [Acuticoccus sp. MNP-M23]|uniref:SPOR domain-containing protein n=1 Tax=Acuticoccus sp. MNP-M23 TaxID=3072793 RepID=UPI0028162DE5|nr:SPOR domain-containing protein [Acuticoccus sp. MNP-M23]WMS42421.1 SPOR domain-containing protein [Acuticoccus sp. MNP-M23]
MDSEPVGWSERRSERRVPAPAIPSAEEAEAGPPDVEPYQDPAPRNGAPEGQPVERTADDVAFSRAPAATGRREAFQARLNAELSRPAPEAPARSAPAPEPDDTPFQPPHAAAPDTAPESRPRRQTEWSKPMPAVENVHPAPDSLADAAEVDDEADSDPVQPVGNEEPVDALDWELDNAIGAIIASSAAGNAATAPPELEKTAPTLNETLEPVPAPKPRHVALEDAAEPDPGPDPFSSRAGATMPQMEAPVRPVSGAGRSKPIPTFRFDRRSDADEHKVAAAPDLDNPLSSIFFQNYRAPAPGEDQDVDSADLLADIDADSDDHEFADYDGEIDDALPPSLVREADRGPRRRFRFAGIAAAIGALAVLSGAVFIGINLFSGDGSATSGEPPIIRADAVDVKVRPAEDNSPEPEPDIAERAEIGDSDSLVMPDRVEIGGFETDAEPLPQDDEAADILSRRVRTVTVRPDGTIVRGGDADAPPAWSAADEASAPESVDAATPAGDASVDVASADPATGTTTGFSDAPTDEEEPFADQALPEETETLAPAGQGESVIPAPRPTPPVRSRTASASTTGGPVDLASQRSAAPAAPAPAVAAADPSAPWGVQVSSQRTEADAMTSYRNLQNRFPSILGSVQPIIMAADLPGRGRFFRVRLAANSRGEAAALCQRLKSAGADCFIGRN